MHGALIAKEHWIIHPKLKSYSIMIQVKIIWQKVWKFLQRISNIFTSSQNKLILCRVWILCLWLASISLSSLLSEHFSLRTGTLSWSTTLRSPLVSPQADLPTRKSTFSFSCWSTTWVVNYLHITSSASNSTKVMDVQPELRCWGEGLHSGDYEDLWWPCKMCTHFVPKGNDGVWSTAVTSLSC